jgi:predicted secreted protein
VNARGIPGTAWTRTRNSATAFILFALAFGTQTALGGEVTLKVLGFSPDGRYFAFEQTTTSYSAMTVMEVDGGRIVKGSRTTFNNEERKRLAKIRKDSAKQLKRLKISPKDLMTVSLRGFDAEPFQEASVKSLALPSRWFGPESWLVMRQFKVLAQRCENADASPIGFGLTLERKDASALQISRDVVIAPERGCPARYRVADAVARKSTDGATALVVIVQDLTPGVSEQNLFMPVTARIPPVSATR